jgi:hypothetical protein
MGNKENINVVCLDGLAWHPAFLAWKRICPASEPPTSIEVLKEKRYESNVYRLRGVTGAGGPVIVKQQGIGELSVEARIYTDVLPALPLPAVDCYGYLEEFHGNAWLFLEDAGEVWYSPDNFAHWPLVTRWMACLHSTPTRAVSGLRDYGPAYFLSVLGKARQCVQSALAHPAIEDPFLAPFQALLGHLDVIENGWPHVVRACTSAPQTLVHGDFNPANVRVRDEGDSAHLLVIDWAWAGAASPAADIAVIPGGRGELRAYYEILREAWPSLAWEDIERLHRIGRIFRLLQYVQWESISFAYPWIERAQRNMAEYERALHGLLQDGLWLNG